MLQEILVFGLFIGAIGFVGNVFWKSMKTDSQSQSGCSACSSSEIKKLQDQFKKKQTGN